VTWELENDLLLRAARRERTERTPVWMMRQAGRFDPEYRALRDKADAPLEVLFRTPEIAAELSLLPQRFGVDAIIYYQDILTPLSPLGADFVFRPGPVLAEPIRSAAQVQALRTYDPADELPFIAKEFELIFGQLRGALPVLGFAGAPLTLAMFMIEGASPKDDPRHTRRMMREAPGLLHELLEKLADMTADYLAYQVGCGVHAVQLFESVADVVSVEEYRTFAHPYHVRVFQRLGATVPTILFAKEQPQVELMAASGADVLSVGACVDLAEAKARFGDRVAFQGNVDNQIVARGTLAEIDDAVRVCVAAGGHEGHILNLNHGVLKDTPFENGCRVVNTCKALRLFETPAPPAR
jgi:uroporphyrinogen decarboxylase